MAAEALLDGEAVALTRKAIELALEGDLGALKLCLERLLPPRRSGRVRLRLPVIEKAEDASSALSRVLAAAAAGAIDIDQAGALGELIDKKRRAVETVELAERVEALETFAENRRGR